MYVKNQKFLQVINYFGNMLNTNQGLKGDRYYFSSRAIQIMTELNVRELKKKSERISRLEEVWEKYQKNAEYRFLPDTETAKLVSVLFTFIYPLHLLVINFV